MFSKEFNVDAVKLMMRSNKSIICKSYCFDNAINEYFFKTIKAELVYNEHYRIRVEVRHSLF